MSVEDTYKPSASLPGQDFGLSSALGHFAVIWPTTKDRLMVLGGEGGN